LNSRTNEDIPTLRQGAEWILRHFWLFIGTGIGLAVVSLVMRQMEWPTIIQAAVGLAGFLLASVAVASQSLTVKERRWVAIASTSLAAVGVMFALHTIRPVPNILFVAVAGGCAVSYVIAIQRRDA
jgi:peptidoglycan/LPS O-acetylase OafA/YrhL